MWDNFNPILPCGPSPQQKFLITLEPVQVSSLYLVNFLKFKRVSRDIKFLDTGHMTYPMYD